MTFLLLIPIIMLLIQALRWLYLRLINRVRGSRNRRSGLIVNDDIQVRSFYVRRYKRIPSIHFINDLDTAKAFQKLQTWNCSRVEIIYQSNYYNWKLGRTEFRKTVFCIGDSMVVELASDWAEILCSDDERYLEELINTLAGCRSEKQADEYNINIITASHEGLSLKQLDINPGSLDINLYYNDDFPEVDRVVRQRLLQPNDKGIVLLHGLPGTGKTTYLRYLIGNLQKKVLFVSPDVAAELASPAFIDLLIDNPNSVLVIEDAENIIMDRKYNSKSSVSNLLNISDGLLSDCLNVQIICTFNSALSLVDSALLRKGRLIAKYEFGKLETAKAQALNEALGLGASITNPMTLAEIMNPGTPDYDVPQVQVIGFRRNPILEN
jgi:hypothetical protein